MAGLAPSGQGQSPPSAPFSAGSPPVGHADQGEREVGARLGFDWKNKMTWRLAAAMLMLSLAAPLAAAAQGYQPHGRGRGGDYAEHGYHGGPGGYGERADGFRGRPNEFRGYGPGPDRGGALIRRERPGDDPGRRAWSRGQYLPPMDRGEMIPDFERHHLRRPPRGYYWYRAGDDYVLAAIATGVIFEVIPGDDY